LKANFYLACQAISLMELKSLIFGIP